jgi:galactokinase
MALVGQRAENEYFGKPCGLMDQLTCAVGGTLKIDFHDSHKPVLDRISFDPRVYGYQLVVVNTGSDHADLTDEYASVTNEMRSVARFFGVDVCRDIDERAFQDRLNEARKACGDRAVLRCIHFFEENKRVEKEFAALQHKDFSLYLKTVQESGDSSMKWLQNIYSTRDPRIQNVTLALALADLLLAKKGHGAYRVHGGGFAGTIQAYVPLDVLEEFSRGMRSTFGPSSVSPIMIRPHGATRLA